MISSLSGRTLSLTCALIIGLSSACLAQERPKQVNEFDAHAKALREKGAQVLTEGLQYVVLCERIPATDGVFGGYVDMLCGLPPQKEHLPLISKLIEKNDPFLQEAGIELACASAKAGNDCSSLEAPMCALLKKTDLDPWVMRAMVEFASLTIHRQSPDLSRFYGALAEAASQPPIYFGKKNVIQRNMPIHPNEDAVHLLDSFILSAAEATPRAMAILPGLEKVHGTKGWKQTLDAIRAKAPKK